VCNTLGLCHCDEGFAPPSCDEPGHGGSLHSGPVKIQGKLSPLLRADIKPYLVIVSFKL